MSQPTAKVPYEVQLAQYRINKMFSDTFKTTAGKKCLEYMRQNHIEKMFENTCFVEAGTPYLAGRAAVNNFILDIYTKIKRVKDGPPSPPDGEKNV